MLQIKGHLCFSLLLLTILTGFMLHVNDSLGFDITLAWDKINAKDFVRYRIFYRTATESFNYLNPEWEGTETNWKIYNLKDKIAYCFMVGVFDNWSNESGHSDEMILEKYK